jgi:hypothetical protein
LTSGNFPKGVNEFEKSGLTPLKSDLIRPFRVKESPIQMECRVEQILPMSDEIGGSVLVLCRILRMHINESVLDLEKNRIDPHKVDAVGRLGRYWYNRASGDSLFEIERRDHKPAIGYEGLPKNILTSEVLTANNIAEIASLPELPTKEAILTVKKDNRVQKALFSQTPSTRGRGLHLLAQEEMGKGNIDFGIKVALLPEVM